MTLDIDVNVGDIFYRTIRIGDTLKTLIDLVVRGPYVLYGISYVDVLQNHKYPFTNEHTYFQAIYYFQSGYKHLKVKTHEC